MMKIIAKIFFLVLALLTGKAMAATCTSVASQDWNKGSAWSGCGGGQPATGDTVIIANGTTIKADSNTNTVGNITINSGGTLQGNSGNTITLSGNFTNNGTFSASSGTVSFTGAAPTITGNVSFANLKLGASTVLTLAGNVTVSGTVTGTITLADTCPTNYTVTVANGTVTNSCASSASASAAATCIPTTVAGIASPLISGVGELQLGNNGKVNGTSIVVSGTTSLPVTGTTSASSAGALPALSPATFPSVGTGTLNTSGTVAAGSYGTINASGNPAVFSGGTYYIDTLKATGPIQLAAGIYYINKLELSANLTVTGVVQLFIGDKVELKNNGISLNSGGNAGNLQVNLYDDAKFDADKNTISFTGLIYSPFDSSEVKFNNNTTLTGAIITAGEIEFKNNMTINYDATVQSQIASLACPVSGAGPDHYELSLPTASIACLPSTATVTACTNANSPCTNKYTAASGKTVALATSGGALGGATVTFDATGVASTTLSYPAAANGTAVSVTLSGEQAAATNARQCCPDGVNCVVANSCSSTFNTGGLIFAATANGAATTIPTQVAGTTSGTYYLRAVKTNTTTMACQSALTGAQTVNFAYECNNPTTCSTGNLMDVSGSSATANNNGGTINYSAVGMTFDANGNAPITFNYSDVGQVKLWANKTVNSASLTGSSNAFVVKPGGFVLSGIKQTAAPQLANPSAVDAVGSKFVKAGEAFTATVTAVTSTAVATPNYGKEIIPEGVILARALILPSGGANGTLSNATIAGGSFNNGVATVTNLAWDEVGIIALTPSIADANYLGVGDVTGTPSGNMGRFIPDHFALTPGTATPACGTVTYFGQDGFSTAFTLTAKNSNNPITTTQNYTGAFAKLSLANWSDFGFTATSPPAGSMLSASVATTSTGSWSNGVATVTAKHQLSRPTALTGETNVVVQAKPSDPDGVTMTAADVTPSTPLRYGRLSLRNAYGSELLALPMSLTAEYWNGTNWATNVADSCTVLTVPTSGSGLDLTHLANSGTTTATLNTLVSGSAGLSLSAPGATHTGYVDIIINSPAWLDFNWKGTGDTDPSARATFGIYKGNNKFIYTRELY